MQSTKTIQSRKVIHSVINQVKVNKSLNYSVNTSISQSSSKYRYVMESASNEENYLFCIVAILDFLNALTHDFGQKMEISSLFVFGQNRP